VYNIRAQFANIMNDVMMMMMMMIMILMHGYNGAVH